MCSHTGSDAIVFKLCLHMITCDRCPMIKKQVENHFSEKKGDIGMSSDEREGEQEDAYTKTETHS